MDINTEIQKAVNKAVQEKLTGLIETKIEKMLDDILDRVFTSYGDTGKKIKKKIEEKLDINLAEFDLVDYNGLVAQTINNQLIETVNMDSIKELTKEIVGFVNKKEVKLTELVGLFIDLAMESDEREAEGSISIYVEPNVEYDWTTILVDLEADKSERDCAFEFLVSGRTGRIFSMRRKEQYFDSVRKNINPLQLNAMNKIEHLIFRYYSANVKIEIDDLHCDGYWSRY